MYLEDGDDGPQKRVKVLSVRHCVACLRLQTELTAEDMHPQDTVTQAGGISAVTHTMLESKQIVHLCFFGIISF